MFIAPDAFSKQKIIGCFLILISSPKHMVCEVINLPYRGEAVPKSALNIRLHADKRKQRTRI